MSKRVLRILGAAGVLLLVLVVGAAAGGGVVYAITRGARGGSLLRLTAAVHAEPSDPEPGVVIGSVVPDGPAAEGGLVRGDILLAVDGEAVDDPVALLDVLGEHEPGEEVQLTVLHGDDERTLSVVLGNRDGKAYLGLVPCGARVQVERLIDLEELGAGALIVGVVPESPAEQAGLRTGDVVTAVDGQALDGENSLADAISAHEPGATVTLEVRRPGTEQRELTVELGEHPDEEGTAYLGVEYRPFVPMRRRLEELPFRRHGLPLDDELFQMHPGSVSIQGVVVRSVVEDSPAAAADLREGDVITALDGDPVSSPEDLSDAIAAHKPGDRVTLTVFQRDEDEERDIDVTLAAHPDAEEMAYLGVTAGGHYWLRRFSSDEWPHGEHSFDFDFDWEALPEELPFSLDELPHHFEFHLPPRPPGMGEQDL